MGVSIAREAEKEHGGGDREREREREEGKRKDKKAPPRVKKGGNWMRKRRALTLKNVRRKYITLSIFGECGGRETLSLSLTHSLTRSCVLQGPALDCGWPASHASAHTTCCYFRRDLALDGQGRREGGEAEGVREGREGGSLVEKERGEGEKGKREGVAPERLTVLRSCVTAVAYRAYCPGNARFQGTSTGP